MQASALEILTSDMPSKQQQDYSNLHASLSLRIF